MKSVNVKIYYLALALSLGACSTGRYVVQGDEYDDVYLVSSDFKKTEARKEQKALENNNLTAEAYDSQYDQRPINNYANPDAMDLPVGSNPNSVVYYPIDNQNANWNNYNSWNNTGWNNSSSNCWNCWGGGGWNSWNSPYYYNSWNNGWGWNSWNRPWGWNYGVGYGWNSWNRPWGWNYGIGYGWGWNSWNNGWGNTIIIDNRPPSKIQVGPRASAGRGSSIIRNNPNPRLQSNTTISNPDAGNQGGRIANTTGGRTRNMASNTYNPTQSNEVRTGRFRSENSNSSYSSGRNSSRSSYNSGRNSSNSSYNSGRNSSSSSYNSGRNSSSSSYSFGRSSGSSGGRSSGSSSGGRSGGGRSPR
ncbi:MAG: hypothetical protein OHK0045_21670 [Raineya sp.]